MPEQPTPPPDEKKSVPLEEHNKVRQGLLDELKQTRGKLTDLNKELVKIRAERDSLTFNPDDLDAVQKKLYEANKVLVEKEAALTGKVTDIETRERRLAVKELTIKYGVSVEELEAFGTVAEMESFARDKELDRLRELEKKVEEEKKKPPRSKFDSGSPTAKPPGVQDMTKEQWAEHLKTLRQEADKKRR